MTVITFVSKEQDSLAALGCDRLVPGMTLLQGGTCSTDRPTRSGRDER